MTEHERPVECAEVLDDIRVAEEQVARGEVLEHDEAQRQVFARLDRLDVSLGI